MPWNCQKSMYLQTNGDFEEATLFSFQKGPICKKMGISTGFYWFFLSFTVHTLYQILIDHEVPLDATSEPIHL